MPVTSPDSPPRRAARMESSTSVRRRLFTGGRHPLLRMIAASLLVLAGAIAGAVALPQAAAAAEIGPGFQEPGKPLNHLGGYRAVDGTIAYCIEAGHPSPLGGVTADSGFSEQVNGLDPASMLRLDVVLTRHGDTRDDRTAAAVAMTVWSIADSEGYAAAGGDERALRRAPEQEREAIRILAEQFRAEAAHYEEVVPSAELRLTIDENDERDGYLEVDMHPATATATVTLDGAEFVAADGDGSTGTEHSTRSVADGDKIAIITDLRDNALPFTVTAVSDDVTITGVPSGTVRVFSTPYAQTLVSYGAPTSVVTSAKVTDVRDRRVPTLSTTAQPTAAAGGTVRDVATVEGIPTAGVFLRFEGYLQPAGATTALCTMENAVYTSTEGIFVERDGEVPSANFAVAAEHVGIVLWVATMTTASGEVLRRGECGDPAETTIITSPPRLPVVSG